MAVIAKITEFRGDGRQVSGSGGTMQMPEYLDWMPIEAKIFWFLDRGFGDPNATHVLMLSQGEQRLVTLTAPLHNDGRLIREREHGQQQRTEDFISSQGLRRTPRNQ